MCLYVSRSAGSPRDSSRLAIGLFNSIMFPVIFT
jgi:fucose permease